MNIDLHKYTSPTQRDTANFLFWILLRNSVFSEVSSLLLAHSSPLSFHAPSEQPYFPKLRPRIPGRPKKGVGEMASRTRRRPPSLAAFLLSWKSLPTFLRPRLLARCDGTSALPGGHIWQCRSRRSDSLLPRCPPAGLGPFLLYLGGV